MPLLKKWCPIKKKSGQQPTKKKKKAITEVYLKIKIMPKNKVKKKKISHPVKKKKRKKRKEEDKNKRNDLQKWNNSGTCIKHR